MMDGQPQISPHGENTGQSRAQACARFDTVRARSLALAAPLSAEDQCIQSMDDTSPAKWHLAHTSWAFETFVLKPFAPGYEEFHPDYNFLFNSYYESIGPRHQRPKRGLLSRPPLDQIHDYRRHVEGAVADAIEAADEEQMAKMTPFLELALNHEQQHQELMLTDIKHAFSCNPTNPVYQPFKPHGGKPSGGETKWIEFPEGLIETGHVGGGFAFDNESPRHKIWLNGFRIAPRPVSNGEFLEFIKDGGYWRPEFWLSNGWAAVQAHGWAAPMYWRQDGDNDDDDDWRLMTLAGERLVDPDDPVCHVSLFEADAFAKWAGKRLPQEAEWERLAGECPVQGNFADSGHYHPVPAAPAPGTAASGMPGSGMQVFGDVWEWTASSYTAYPGYRAAIGAMGEYNGKFMSGQMVLRGGSAATPEGHIRSTYRNFFYPPDRWQFSGLRLAEDV